jgi:hypothetical protein
MGKVPNERAKFRLDSCYFVVLLKKTIEEVEQTCAENIKTYYGGGRPDSLPTTALLIKKQVEPWARKNLPMTQKR